MNQNRNRLLTLWLALALAILPALRAQEAPPPTPAPEKPATVEPAKPEEKAVEPRDDEEDKPSTEVAPADETKKSDEPAPAAEEVKSTDEAPLRDLTSPAEPTDQKPAKKKSTRSRSYGARQSDDFPAGSHTVPAGQQWHEVVSIMGNSTVEGSVAQGAVSIMGTTTVNGEAREAVAVMGDVRVNGQVHQEVVVVMGNLVLGPRAKVNDVVVVMGEIIREGDAQITGDVENIGSFGPFKGFGWLHAWVTKCLFWGRPLGFGEGLGWAWLVAAGFLAFYLLLGLVFPKAIDRCAETLEQRPGGTFLAALLTMLLSPILFVLLAITGVGVFVIPFLGIAVFLAGLFGKAAMFAWLGRRITKPFGDSVYSHAFFTVLIGGLITLLLYTIPIGGFIIRAIFGFLGMGAVVYTLALAMKSSRPAKPTSAPVSPSPTAPASPTFAAAAGTPSAVAFGAPAAPVQSAGFGAATAAPVEVPPVAPPVFEPVPPVYGAAIPSAAPSAVPPLAAATLPRAGFWIRVAAAFLDTMIIIIPLGIAGGMEGGPGLMFLCVAAYHAVMWKLKGTTIGGVICGLKVVRLDDRPIDWGVAIVRALSAFISFFPACLGFIWVAFDDEKQSWHDKIAGTTVVRVPKGTSLL
jgi:uncharacterized RDD family membrane protein YckC